MEHLRPLERRILAMRDEGTDVTEIARRTRRSPEHVERIITWTSVPRTRSPHATAAEAMERRVLKFRENGMSHEQIADRFRRGPRFIRQVEALAHLRQGLRLLAVRDGS